MKKVMVSWLLCFSFLLSKCFLLPGCNKISYPEDRQYDDFIEIPGLLISEILPDPHKGSVEFVEIYNNSTQPINLNTVQLATTNSTGKRSRLHSLSNTDLILSPFTYKLLSSDSELVQAHYLFLDTLAFHKMSSFPTLTNSNGAVIIFKDGDPIDSLYYTVNMHDVFIKNPKGVSLERVSFSRPTNSNENFISASATPGYATPGYQNSQLTVAGDNTNDVFLNSVSFSPGQHEELKINFRFYQGGKMVNIIIYNANGKEVRTLLKNHRLGTKDIISWDGLDNAGKSLSIGVYHLSIEIYDSKGYLKRFKKSCVLAKT